MPDLVTCNFEEDLIKNGQEKLETSFPHYKSIGHFSCHSNHSFGSCLKPVCRQSPIPTMLHIKFDSDWSIGLRDNLVSKCEQLWMTD